ncbi:MAG: hypothetical protein QOE36_1993 [Gaiellaceae bacterium]|jgi:hypothetical protein|nr:hypothetical protein [Gaiellaceae bacterium]
MANAREKVLDQAGSVKPYIERAVKDEDLRDNVMSAFAAAREVYDELLGNRGAIPVARKVATDKDMQANLKTALDELRTAVDRVQGKKDHSGRNSTLLLAGITLGILFNPMTGPATRKFISDKLFGSSDDFTYNGNSSGSSS